MTDNLEKMIRLAEETRNTQNKTVISLLEGQLDVYKTRNEALKQEILARARQAINNAAPTDDEEEYEGRSEFILEEALMAIINICQQ
jgi:hypothetical protein